MFSYLRYFSAISSLLVIIAAIGLGMYFREIAEQDLERLVQRNNQALIQGFTNTTWKKHHDVIMRLYQLPVKEWPKYIEFQQFKDDVFRYFEQMPVVKVNVYTRNGEFVLSSDQTKVAAGNVLPRDAMQVFKSTGEESQFFAMAQQGMATNRVVTDVTFRTADDSQHEGTLVQTLVPILSDRYVEVIAGSDNTRKDNIEGIVEVFYDVTPQWKQMYLFQLTSSGGIIVIFLLLITLLMTTSSKAEAIIAKQHETNLELTATAAAAEAENRNKSQFLANISHELRTPLNAIIGFSEIMKNEVLGTLENTQYQDYIRDIHSSGVHLLSLINDILDYSKAEAGKLELEITEVDSTKIIQNSMRLVSPRAEMADVKLVENLPKEHYVIETDAKKLKQIMLNLLSNAVKFTPAKGEVRVTMWHNLVDNTVAIEVKDTGIGIAPKDISRAMSPFGQVDSALSRKYEGTGLGLPLTKKFVELMGGEFSIQSEVNAGTTITFTLPVQHKPKAETSSGTA